MKKFINVIVLNVFCLFILWILTLVDGIAGEHIKACKMQNGSIQYHVFVYDEKPDFDLCIEVNGMEVKK